MLPLLLAGGIAADQIWNKGKLTNLDRTKNEFRQVDPNGDIAGQAGAAGVDADNWRDQGFYRGQSMDQTADRMGGNANYWGGVAQGQNSVSQMQLRQAMQQNQAAQHSMAAGARGSMAPMAQRTAAIQSARLGAGLAGQQAIAGLQERQQAAQLQQQALMGQGNLYGQARGQDLNASLGSRQNALSGYGAIEQARGTRFNAISQSPTTGEHLLGALQSGAQMAMMKSDRRAKTGIRSGDRDAEDFLSALKAYNYKYKSKSDGDGEQLGVMAQDLERTKFGKQVVMNTDGGKMVHGAKLAGALAAAAANMHKRIAKLEGK